MRKVKKKWHQGKQVFGYGPTPEAASADLARKIEALSTRSIEPIAPDSTFHEWVKAVWYPKIVQLRPATRARYESAYIRHIRPHFRDLALTAIRPADVQNWVNQLASAKIHPNGHKKAALRLMEPKGVQFVYSILAMIFRALVNEDAIHKTPCRGIALPRRKPKRERMLSLEDAARLMDSLQGNALELPTMLALCLGLRRGEICALKWDDLDRQARTLKVQRQRQKIEGRLMETSLKTSASKRTLRLPQEFVDFIDSRGDLDSPYLCTFAGEQWRPDEITRVWTKWQGRPDGFTFHDLRHCAASLIVAATGNIKAASAVLGHASLDMTLIYVADESQRAESVLSGLTTILATKE